MLRHKELIIFPIQSSIALSQVLSQNNSLDSLLSFSEKVLFLSLSQCAPTVRCEIFPMFGYRCVRRLTVYPQKLLLLLISFDSENFRLYGDSLRTGWS